MKYCPFKRNIMNKDYKGSLVFNNEHSTAKVEIEFGECDETRCMAYDSRNPIDCKCTLIEKGTYKC